MKNKLSLLIMCLCLVFLSSCKDEPEKPELISWGARREFWENILNKDENYKMGVPLPTDFDDGVALTNYSVGRDQAEIIDNILYMISLDDCHFNGFEKSKLFYSFLDTDGVTKHDSTTLYACKGDSFDYSDIVTNPTHEVVNVEGTDVSRISFMPELENGLGSFAVDDDNGLVIGFRPRYAIGVGKQVHLLGEILDGVEFSFDMERILVSDEYEFYIQLPRKFRNKANPDKIIVNSGNIGLEIYLTI